LFSEGRERREQGDGEKERGEQDGNRRQGKVGVRGENEENKEWEVERREGGAGVA